jgi:uncharacterized protein with von Willebrand factor type A (vWA) domain
VKLLLLFDIGGSMDAHVKICEELFSACKTEFKHLEYLLLPQLRLRVGVEEQPAPHVRAHATQDLLHKYGADYKVIFIGDAAMAPYEITQPGGSVEHWNEEPGTCGCSASWRSTRSSSGSTRIRRTPGATPPRPTLCGT